MSSDLELPTSSFHMSPDLRPADSELPSQIGRYQVVRELGHGGFGTVYLALDQQLLRHVAVKVPFVRADKSDWSADDWLAEAQIVASLDHPHIVPVYDVGSSPEFPAFIVSKLIDGTSLSAAMKQQRLSISESVKIVISVGDALNYAHTRGLVHRDVKPSNIMLDKNGHAYLTDFGLAMREEQYGLEDDRLLGTLHYMSPEQARREGHLVDGRADIFSLGVVLYELLSGVRPFQGRTTSDVLRAVTSHDPRPLRQQNGHIPRDLERICVHALAKRASERYSTAKDFTDDLRHFLAGADPNLPAAPVTDAASAESRSDQRLHDSRSGLSATMLPTIVPKGLRAFDESDCDFFLGLLPGPHDRDRLPQSLRFWKSRIEEPSSATPLRIGVVYGPSGCGKSSLIRAGLLPRLSSSVHSLLVTATAQTTEARLFDELRPMLDRPASGLVEAMQRLRRSPTPDRKVLIVIDQFEQWLHANPNLADLELVQALRQCDGEHVSCLLIVRDDFWMSVHRFFRELDVRLAERENCAAVDLFDRRHARRVLHAFGHAYEALPERTDELSPEQREFLDRAIDELAEDDRVICVRLALFAQMVRSRPWTPDTLRAIGGARGVGIRFLEDTFGSASAPLSYRIHQVAIREILRALLPAPGTDIKACTRTANELASAARCDANSVEFQHLLGILEEETRLLTPVDTSLGTTTDSSPASRSQTRSYQLTHDYLVPSIREWLTRKQRETWRGRCELRLAERAGLWSSRPERKQLPSLWETVQITVGTKSANWTAPQASMMRQAQRWHGRRLLTFGLLLTCVSIGGTIWSHRNQQALRHRMANVVVDQLLVAEVGRIIPVLRELDATRDVWTERLRRLANQPDASSADKLRAELALVSHDPQRLAGLLQLVLDSDAETLRVVREWLAASTRPAPEELWSLAQLPRQSAGAQLRIAVLLAEFDPQAEGAWQAIAVPVANTLVTDVSLDANAWAELLRPVRERLAPALADLFLSGTASSSQRLSAAQLLSKLGSAELLCRIIPDADATSLSLLMRALSLDRDAAVERLRTILDASPPADEIGTRLRHVGRQRTAAVALMLLGRDDLVWPLLSASPDSSLRTELMLTLRTYGVPFETLLRGEETVRDPVARQAIWQSLAASDVELSPQEKGEIERRIRSRWPLATHQSERAGIAWLAQKCGLSEMLRVAPSQTPPSGSDWLVNSQGQMLLKVQGPIEFLMGVPDDEPRRNGNERQHRRRIDRSFAIGVCEVTAEQFRRYRPDYAPDPLVCPTPDCPAIAVSWIDAAKYCRWLSEQEGIPEDQMCYPPVDHIHAEMEFRPDLLSRTSYRLPTEAEWEYACRAGTTNRNFFGDDERHLSDFGWWIGNSRERTWPVGTVRPNQFGLFDMQGNVHEWCQDALEDYVATADGLPVGAVPAELRGLSATDRVFRGANYRTANRVFRSANRLGYAAHIKFSILGFRIARTSSAR